jgi:hypothetical protein
MADGGSHDPDPAQPPAGEGTPPGAEMVAFMSAVHGANEAARVRRADQQGGSCGETCGCHA